MLVKNLNDRGIRLFKYDQRYILYDITDSSKYVVDIGASGYIMDNVYALSNIEGVVFYIVYYSNYTNNNKSYHKISMLFGISSLLGNNGFLLESLSSYLKDDPMENWFDDLYNIKWTSRECHWDDHRGTLPIDVTLDNFILSQSKEWHDQVYEIFNDSEIDLWLNEWRGDAMYMNSYGDIPEYWKLKGVEEVVSIDHITFKEVDSLNSDYWEVRRIHHLYNVYLSKKKWKYFNRDLENGFYDSSGELQGTMYYFHDKSLEVAIEFKSWYPVQLKCYPLDLLSKAIRCYNKSTYVRVFNSWLKNFGKI